MVKTAPALPVWIGAIGAHPLAPPNNARSALVVSVPSDCSNSTRARLPFHAISLSGLACLYICFRMRCFSGLFQYWARESLAFFRSTCSRVGLGRSRNRHARIHALSATSVAISSALHFPMYSLVHHRTRLDLRRYLALELRRLSRHLSQRRNDGLDSRPQSRHAMSVTVLRLPV